MDADGLGIFKIQAYRLNLDIFPLIHLLPFPFLQMGQFSEIF